MKFKYICVFILLAGSIFLLFGTPPSPQASTQQSQPAQCPQTKTSCPDTASVGDKLSFTANVSGGDKNVTPTYNWTVSAGAIASGQGTSTIEVDTSAIAADSTVTATVDVGGFDRSCGYGSTASSCTATISKKLEARKLDEYSNLKSDEETRRLDNFVIELQNDPMAQGYILAYNGRKSSPKDAQKAASKAREYLTKMRGLGADRMVIVEGGYREQPAIELWLVPSGAPMPNAAPTLRPDEIKSVKPAKPKAEKSRKKS